MKKKYKTNAGFSYRPLFIAIFRNKSLACSCLLLTAALLFNYQHVSAQFLHTEGTKIVDANGEEIILRGIGLGGGHPAIEVDVVITIGGRLGRNRHLHPIRRHQVIGGADQGLDAVRVAMARFGRVVGPTESLDRVIPGRVARARGEPGIGLGNRESCRQPDLGKAGNTSAELVMPLAKLS